MRQIFDRPLWIGNASDLHDWRRLADVGIEAVVELADNEPLATLPRGLVRLAFPLSDIGENPTWLIRLAIASVTQLIQNRVGALVCCSAGMNRSVGIVAASLAHAEQRRLQDCLVEIAELGPVDLAPAFYRQLSELAP